MELGQTKFEAGAVCFALQYRALMPDQGLCIQVAGEVDGHPSELLRFDCFDQNPHYHYDPQGRNERHNIDKTTAGNPLGWTLKQLRTRLPEMLTKAGYPHEAHLYPGNHGWDYAKQHTSESLLFHWKAFNGK